MADEPMTQTDDVQEDPDGRITISRAAFDNMRAAAERKAEPVSDPKLARENAFLRAGVDLDNPNAAFLMDGWGERPLDPAAIREAAERMGALTGALAAAPPPSASTPPPDADQTATRAALQSDSTPPGNEPPTPSSLLGIKQGQQVLAQGGSDDEAIAVFIARVREGAMAGDQSVIIRGGGDPGEPVGNIAQRKGYDNIREVLR